MSDFAYTEYFPYGETWINDHVTVDEQQAINDLPYKFTSKELDPETGYYYYGARYYDAQLSRWISVDPPLTTGEYIGKDPGKLPGMGGVFNPINLNAYQYAGLNPVKFVDPDGNAYAVKRTDGTYGYQGTSNAIDIAYSTAGWFPAGNRIGDYVHDKLGVTRVPSYYDDPEMQARLMESIGISSTALGYASYIKKLGTFGKTLGKLANRVGTIANAYSTYTATTKDRSDQDTVETVIEGFGVLEGYDKEFIGIVAPYVEEQVQDIVKKDGISVQCDKFGRVTGTSGRFSKQGWKDLKSLNNDIKGMNVNWKVFKMENER